MNPIELILKTDDIVAVNKPTGVSVHNNEDDQNLLTLLEKQLSIKRLYPVHRLDKETSGVQIFALNESAAKKYSEEFQQGSVKKIYLGVLKGTLNASEGVWNTPLTDKAEGRRSPDGQPRDRVPCETKYRVLKSSKYFSLCEFDLVTGRQHQIRKHSTLARHPLVGDPRYGDPKYNSRMAEIYGSSRMFLHCSRVEIAGLTLIAPTPKEFELIVNNEN